MGIKAHVEMRLHHFFKGQDRNKKVALNVFNSFFVKGLSIITTFLLIPISINYVDKEIYGLWLTISSIITWIGLFDLGLTNGLRNNITEAYAKQEYGLARIYLSTTYAILFITIVPVCLVFILVCDYINWQSFFNTNVDRHLLNTILKLTFTAFCLQLLLQPINAFLMALHKHYLSSLITLIGNVCAVLLIISFGHSFRSSFLFLSIVLSYLPVLCLLLFSFILFKGSYSILRPGFKWIRLEYKNKLFKIGLKFFIIQVAGLIIFSSNNILISHIKGNESVTIYNVVFRYFSLIAVIQSLVLAPLWTGYTDAYVLRDYSWIRKATKKVNLFSWSLTGCLVVMTLLSNYIYKIWINEHFTAPFAFTCLMALNVGLSLFSTHYTIFINGAGKIRLQTYISVIIGVLHIPLAYFLMHSLAMGLSGLIILNIVWTGVSLLLWSYQHKRILADSPSVIWNT